MTELAGDSPNRTLEHHGDGARGFTTPPQIGIGLANDRRDDTTPAPGLPRWFDLIAAALGLGVLAPFLVLVWLLIRLESPGSPIFRQKRIGLRGRPFICYKFRTMRMSAARRPPIAVQDFQSFVFSPPGSPRDPRVTGFGHVLRVTSIDEFPQFVNVIRGEMKLVGPRPELPEIVAQYPPAYHRRHAVPPGLSGLAQIRGRADLTYAASVAYDLRYVQQRSIRLDLTILSQTLASVVRRTGAR